MRYINWIKNKIISFEGLLFLLVIILAGFTALPLTSGNDDLVVVSQANLQPLRSEFLAKDVLILAYRPSSYHSQAISELQTVLPVLQQAQNGFNNGNVVLGIPNNPPVDVEQALLDAQPRYNAMVTAIKSILAHPDKPPDPTEVNIVLMNEYPYTLAMYQVAILEEQHAQWSRDQLIAIKLGMDFIILLILLRPRALSSPPHDDILAIKLTD